MAQIDTTWAIAHHVSGDEYAVRIASVWTDGNEHCTGSTIIAAVGPLAADEPRDNLADNYESNATDEDVAWLNAEEDAGRITYPQAGAS